MGEFFETVTARFILWTAALAAMVVVGIYLVDKVRTWALAKAPNTSDLITKFRELHAQGDLSDEEYRTIKSTLADRFEGELKENGDEG